MIARLDVHAFRVPVDEPVATSFGVMRDRPAVFVRVEAADGAFGWGEIFANWPAAGAEHRARLLVEDVADLAFALPSDDPRGAWAALTRACHVRAVQCGEPGPFAQVLAGLDTALHDLAARRAGLPLACYLDAEAAGSVPAYASGIAASGAPARVAAARAAGFAAFKVKVGFDARTDLDALRVVAGGLAAGERLMADANQAWDLGAARAFMAEADALGLAWMEEPLPADAPAADWAALTAATTTPLAAGENVAGEAGFARAVADGVLSVIQPDVAKWGGVTGCEGVARRAVSAGRSYCPHFLGGGIGLIASAHLLAAVGGPGLLEVDVNPNPLRDAFGDGGAGRYVALGDRAGAGDRGTTGIDRAIPHDASDGA